MNLPLSSFPHLTSSEFTAACISLHDAYQSSTLTLTPSGSSVLSFRRPLPNAPSPTIASDPGDEEEEVEEEEVEEEEVEEEVEEEEQDPESLPPRPILPPHQHILYELHYSTSYTVPVLYFLPPIHWGLDDIYDRLVPTDSAEALKRVGVLGAVSQGEHPVTGEAWWFVHPCATAEAMEVLQGLWEGTQMGAEEWYVRVLVGLVGGVVGLRLGEGEYT